MDNALLLSIIIPVYKVEKYIERCILSVMHQNCMDVQMECILVDDCSPDSSISIAERLIEDYSGDMDFKIIRHDKNLGLSAARNTGIKHASGEYLFFIDSDDYITDDCIQKLTDAVKIYPEVEVVKGNHRGKVQIDMARIPRMPLNNNTLLDLSYMYIIPPMAWNTLIKKSLIDRWGLSFRQGLVYEDNLWSVQLFRHTNSFVIIPDITYNYESNPESILGDDQEGAFRSKYLPHKIIIVNEYLNTFDIKHFVPYTLLIVTFLTTMFDSIKKDGKDDNLYKQVQQLRNRLMRITLRHSRIVLATYELLLFIPFRMLIQYRFFRQNYYRIEKMTYTIAKSFDRLHIMF